MRISQYNEKVNGVFPNHGNVFELDRISVIETKYLSINLNKFLFAPKVF